MKLLHTADLHLGMTNYSKLDPETGLESRLLDFFNTFDWIIDKAIESGVDAFIFAGDAYKTRDPSPTQQKGFGERIKKLAKKIPVVMVVGNHDTPNAQGKANTLDIYSALEIDNVWVSRKPEVLNIPTKSGNLQVITAPWLHKGEFKILGDFLPLAYSKINSSTKSGPTILVGHLEIEGASFGSEKGMALINDATIPLALLTEKKLNYVALGHIHKHQVLCNNPLVIYSGSSEKIDFGEEKEEKGVILIDIPTSSKTSYQFIPTPARQFETIKVSLKADDQNPTQTILEEIKNHTVQDKIVRVIIDIPADLDQDIEIDKIKKAVSGAYCLAAVTRNIERKERVRLEGTDEVERLTPIQALQKYFETKKYSLEKIKLLEKVTQELLEN